MNIKNRFRTLLWASIVGVSVVFFGLPSFDAAEAATWDEIVLKAKGQTV